MSGTTKTTQEGNIVGGHQAGRDVFAPVISLPQKRTYMQALIAQYRQEAAANPELQSIIAELQHYLIAIDKAGQKVVGLEAKLSVAGREDDTQRATRLKEIFVKKLERNRLSETAQHIYAYILGKIHRVFRFDIQPLIKAEADRTTVDQAIYEKILEPVIAELEDNVLHINHDEMEGMLYFLTGNCHLRWDGTC